MSHYDNQFKYYQHYVYKPIIYRLTSSSVIMFSSNTSFRLWKKYSVIKYSKTYLKKKFKKAQKNTCTLDFLYEDVFWMSPESIIFLWKVFRDGGYYIYISSFL